ncbi:interferon-induced helicase C domain-containing protein 1-like isoform X2 [Oncorhynchus keta]|uniref:interferon-induced helicase C domain-containing protein 1-like isoform X2 n=1 Tax=Oncorhynchus keta TaxID=8018 RepID=UPI0015FA8614|nr:interferon-induced helicase C domain-containing protein 1-like isoform X2 [Oncorhynchus keta]
MAADKDNTANISLIDNFRPRLRKLIEIEFVLDHLNFLDNDNKDLIRTKARKESNLKAVDLLIDTIIRIRPLPKGWFREFVDALSAGGCKHAATYVEDSPPCPALEAENDNCVRLIELLSPSLLRMKTTDVCWDCFSKGILTTEDREIILAECQNRGNMGGARELLRRIVRFPPGWFSTFLKALQVTEHKDLCKELTGESPGDNLIDEPGVLMAVNEAPGNVDPMVEEGPVEAAGKPFLPEQDTLDSSVTSMNLDEPSEADSEIADLYSGTEEPMENGKPENSLDLSMSGCIAPAAESPPKAVIVLRDYQMDVARPALEGKNIIICLPTGSGKTRVAVYITKEHLDSRRKEGRPGKVVVLVNKVPLVEQHYSTEFWKFLKNKYKVERVSGDSQLKISFTDIVQKNDIVICTAQLLENYLERAHSGDDDGIKLSDLSLIVIDECHHTQKGGVYNHIMIRYLKQKHKNAKLKKEQKDTMAIPQILGLTASPGVGGAKKIDKAEEHILRICANLDAYKIMTGNLGENKKEPHKKIATAEERKEDPFGDVLKGVMNAIHIHAELNPTCDLGTQNYEQWVVQKEQNAAKEENQKVRVCAEHLRQYNEALYLGKTIRMWDAFSFLDKYFDEELKKKVAPEDEEAIIKTDTERFLFTLFKDSKVKLQELAKLPQYENNSLAKLRTKILHEFTSREKARGIIFTKTRRSAIALAQWVQENSKFEEVGVKACHVIGGGGQSVVKPMTAAEQRDVLNKFQSAEINLLIATTVAEEGLDIAACNFVIRYELVTNEIAMIQARGRGRAEDSSYTLVAGEGSGVAERESVNEYREKMMSKAIDKVKKLDQEEYEKRIKEFQIQAIMEERVRTTKKKQKGMKKESPSKVKFSCRSCNKPVCSGEDVEIIENMHRVNVTPQFKELFIQRENTSLVKRLLDYETNGFIACKDCGQRWGSMMLYRGIECPCLHVKNFLVTYDEKRKNVNKWSEVGIQLPAFDYAEHARSVAESSEDEESM